MWKTCCILGNTAKKMLNFVETSKRGVSLKSHKNALEGGMDD